MNCNKCGNQINPDDKFCTKCGNPIINNNPPITNSNINNNSKILNNFPQKNKYFKFIAIGVGCLILVLCLYLGFKKGQNYYFDTTQKDNENEIQNKIPPKNRKNKYSTIIVEDNVYNNVKIRNKKDAFKLIKKDSESQKSTCPKEIIKIENDIIKKYNITAVNLCEMDVDFAKELENVLDRIYKEFPMAIGYITNITLMNGSKFNGFIAAFSPFFIFAQADTDSTYPWVNKIRILLNSKYFLNPNKLDIEVKKCSEIGHFPPNSTRYSSLAHEMGHVLSYLSLVKKRNIDQALMINNDNITDIYSLTSTYLNNTYSYELIKEAYDRYLKDTGNLIDFDDWRSTISKYAMAKDNNGIYIYDETIAESFHDIYLNGDNAKDASKYVFSVLKERLNN